MTEGERKDYAVTDEERFWADMTKRYRGEFVYEHAPKDAQEVAEQLLAYSQRELEEFQADTESRITPHEAVSRIRAYDTRILIWGRVLNATKKKNWDFVKGVFLEEGLHRVSHHERYGECLIYLAVSLPQGSTEE